MMTTATAPSQMGIFKKAKESPAAPLVNILVVDDLPEKLMAYKAILDELGQNVITANSGEQALKLVLQNEFAVILLDVNMPGMDGFETATTIRQRRKSARTPIIFLTAFTDEINMAQGYASGAVDYLPTPVVPEVFKAKVRVFIELFQMRQQAAYQAEEAAHRAAAEEADRRKDEFLGMLAHELRNPLGPIRTAVHILQHSGKPDGKTLQLYDIIGRQVTHMVRLIDDLLDATRLARGQILLRKEMNCDLNEMVRQITDDYQGQFEANGLQLHVTEAPLPLRVQCDPTRINQAIGNLLHNAHKFTGPGGTVSVFVESDPASGIAHVKVRDTGVGITPDILPRIFEVFHQGEQGLDRHKGGLGLGLALVKGLVELHGGEVGAHSEGTGQGAEFCITLPLQTLPTNNNEQAKPEDSITLEKSKILLIEDNIDTAESMRMLLNMEGHDVKVAHSGPEGIAAAHSFSPQVILCDIGLPGMDGYHVARKLREGHEFTSTYIVALTGYGRDEDQILAAAAGFDLHLTKPIDYGLLKRTLAHRLQQTEQN